MSTNARFSGTQDGTAPVQNPRKLPDGDFYTVRELATALRIEPAKVLAWIHAGTLRAMNVAQSATGRPRWRVSREAWEAFAAARSNAPAAPARPATRRPQRRSSENIIEFY